MTTMWKVREFRHPHGERWPILPRKPGLLRGRLDMRGAPGFFKWLWRNLLGS